MPEENFNKIFTTEVLQNLLPPERSDIFFEALFGDASEGAYDISLQFESHKNGTILNFALHLNQRPGKCLACNLTQGLPQILSRHPVINLAGIAEEVRQLINHGGTGVSWRLGSTQQHSSALHTIPFIIEL